MSDISLSPMQHEGVKKAAAWFKNVVPDTADIFTLVGFAGTGKTTVLPYIIDGMGLHYEDVAFCAPTGKAAKVITGKLRDVYGDHNLTAKTIHSLMYVPLREKVEKLREEVREFETRIQRLDEIAKSGDPFDEQVYNEHMAELRSGYQTKVSEFTDAQRESERTGLSFSLNPNSVLAHAKLIVVDEASMVGESIVDDLMFFNKPILAIGDSFQLPPVGEKPGFDLQDPDFFLTEIHRQAADNPIIRLSMDIREGRSIRQGKMGSEVSICRERDDPATLNPDYDAQVICGTHKRRWMLTSKIRKMCGFTSNGPEVDEPLIVSKNSRKIPSLVNGSFVVATEVPDMLHKGDSAFYMVVETEEGTQHRIRCYQGQFEEHFLRQKDGATADKFKAFDSRKRDEILDFGWVITAHKSQGSQWDNVVVHDESATFRQEGDRWLYTAVTRAANELTLVLP